MRGTHRRLSERAISKGVRAPIQRRDAGDLVAGDLFAGDLFERCSTPSPARRRTAFAPD